MNADPIKLGRETLPEATRNALISTHKHSSLSSIFINFFLPRQRNKLKNRLPQLIINKSVGRRKERGDDETWGVAHNTWACDSCVVKCRNADTYINESRVISFLDVVQDWSFIEKGQHGHVFHLVKLWWVHLLQVIFWNVAAFASLHDFDFHFISPLSLDGSRDISKVFVWNPNQHILGPFFGVSVSHCEVWLISKAI